MADIFSKKKRSEIMSLVKTRGTDIENKLSEIVKPFWKIEHYRKNVKDLPGKPDIAFVKSKVAIFADGDFWHGRNFEKWGNDIPKFWQSKILSNINRDDRQTKELKKLGYKILRFWGSDIKKKRQKIFLKIAKYVNGKKRGK